MSFAKVKEEEVERETGAFGWTEDAYEEFRRASQEAREGLREAARKLAADAGLSSHPARPEWEPAARDVNRHGGAHVPVAASHVPVAAVSVKTPKYSGRSDWEAFPPPPPLQLYQKRRGHVTTGSGPPVGPISPAVCAVEPEVSDPLPVASVNFPMTYVPQAAHAQS
ncbi:unnamed protein product [Gadus morhua 'NCC']